MSRTAGRWGVASAVLAWLVTAGLVLATLVGPAGYTPWRDTALYLAALVTGWLAIALRACTDRRHRAVWRLLAAALGASLAGEVVLAWLSRGDQEPGFPSIADGLFAAFYPLCYLALLSLVRRGTVASGPGAALDGPLAALAALSVLAATLGPPALGSGSSEVTLLISLAFPLLDGVLVLTVLAGAVALGRAGARWLVPFGLGLLVLAGADFAYSIPVVAGTYVEGTWTDALWPLSSALLATAAWMPDRALVPRPLPRWLRHAVPLVAITIAGSVLTWAGLSHLGPVAVLLGATTLVVGVVRLHLAIVETRSLARTAHVLGTTDSLTGLPNRRTFGAACAARLSGPDPNVAIVLLDVDRFTEINDSLGHTAGDDLLRHVADALRAGLRSPDDVAARLGGDEFGVLLADADEASTRAALARLHGAVHEPIELDGITVRPSVTIGVALAPVDGADPSLLLRRADIALRRARTWGVRSARYDTALGDLDREDRVQRLAEVRDALRSGAIEVHYQPQVDLVSGTLTGTEALVRWRRDGALVPPLTFLPLVQDGGLMPELTDRVLTEALEQSARWRGAGLDLSVSVNLPATALDDAQLPDRVADLLRRHDVPAGRLVLEITEESVVTAGPATREVLDALRRCGAHVSLDDFGAGYSSLAYLRDLAVDEVKLDRAFVEPLPHDGRASAVARSTIELAHLLGMRVVAEGVETAAAAAALARFGCDVAQGFHLSPALPAAELEAWARSRPVPPSGGTVPPAHPAARRQTSPVPSPRPAGGSPAPAGR